MAFIPVSGLSFNPWAKWPLIGCQILLEFMAFDQVPDVFFEALMSFLCSLKHTFDALKFSNLIVEKIDYSKIFNL